MKPKSPALVLPLAAISALALTPVAPASASNGAVTIDHGPQFEDVSAQLDFQRIDEDFTAKLGGAAWVDYDDDGDLDLFLVNAPGGDNALYRNDAGSFTDVAGTAGVTGEGSGFTGALAGDIDNDGCTDLFLTGAGGFLGAVNPHRLYLNDCDGTFTDVTINSGIDPLHNGIMAAFGDIDADGYLDLFVTSGGSFVTGVLTTQKLYHNEGDGTFTDISASAGIDSALGGCVVGFSDFDNDWRLDIIVGNCDNLDNSGQAPAPIVGPWELWMNQGDLTFVDEADARGLNARPGFPMSTTIGDYDRDGDLDVFATGTGVADPFGAGGILGEQVLFDNDGFGYFTDKTYAQGLGGYEFGWGAAFSDFDADGDQDLATVGSVALSFMQLLGPLAGPGRVFENDGHGMMEDVLDFGLDFQATSGLAVGDYDADGFTDLVIVKTAYAFEDTPFGPISGDGAPVLLHNVGNGNEAMSLRLRGNESNAMGIGARVQVWTPQGGQVQEVVAGSSFASTNSPWLTFGMGACKWGYVKVFWPAGHVEAFIVSTEWGLTTLEEGTGIPL